MPSVHPTVVVLQNEGLCIVTPKHFLCASFFVLSAHTQFRSIVPLVLTERVIKCTRVFKPSDQHNVFQSSVFYYNFFKAKINILKLQL